MLEWFECLFSCLSCIQIENKLETTEEYKEIIINE